MAYPLMVLVLATTASYPPIPELIDRLTEARGTAGVPLPPGPVDVPQGPGACVMQSAAEVDQPVWVVDQRGEQVGGERVFTARVFG